MLVLLAAVPALYTSPVDVLQRWRHARLQAFSQNLHDSFVTASTCCRDRYQVRALVVDSGDGTAQVCAALLNHVTEAAGISRHLHLHATSSTPTQRATAGFADALQFASAHGRLAVQSVPLCPFELRSGGPYDLVLTTDISGLDCVRAMATEEHIEQQVHAFCLTDFAFGGDESDARAAVQALLSLPEPLRRTLAAHPGGLGSRIDLPRAASEGWDDYLALGTACALGFSTRLKQSISAHARKVLMSELVESYPTVESLEAHEVHVHDNAAGGLSLRERRRIIRAYVEYLRKTSATR